MTLSVPSQAGTPTWSVTPQTGLQINSVAVSPDGSLTVAGTSAEFGSGQFYFYAYSADGSLLWQVPVTAANATQGVFWVAVSDNKTVAAAGGETAKDVGFLSIVDASNGTVLLSETQLPSRVNQLTFSADGTLLLADLQHQVLLYACVDGQWQQQDQLALPAPFSSYSAVLANDGSRVWVAGINYQSQPATGLVMQVPVSQQQFGTAVSYAQSSGVMRIVTTPDGQQAAVALHNGGCAFYQAAQTDAAVLSYQPSVSNLSVAYAVAIAAPKAGDIAIVVGANLNNSSGDATAPGGLLYRIDLLMSQTEIANYPQWQLQAGWSHNLQYAVNPGVTLDSLATKVTATDGKPDESQGGSDTKESPGNFYLLDACSGTPLWQYGTKLMNWPMALTPDAQAAVGGSDDGSLYYWDLRG